MKMDYDESRKRICFMLLMILGGYGLSWGQAYTYTNESFEQEVWLTSPKNPTLINSSTGTWSVYRDNVRVDTPAALDGNYCLALVRKDGLITPELTNGAGTLTYFVRKSSSRTIYIETSVDKSVWSTPVDTYVITDDWVKRTVLIDDPEVRYVRFRVNSNGGVFLDNVLITSAGASDVMVETSDITGITQTSAMTGGNITVEGDREILERGVCYNTIGIPDIQSDKTVYAGIENNFSVRLQNLSVGTTYYAKAYAKTSVGVNYGNELTFTTREADAAVAYWIQPFDDTAQFPGSEPASPVSIEVEGQGEWIYYKSYKDANVKYITDNSPYCLRMIKGGSYVITPLLEDGVTEFSFNEGRKERELTIYTSVNGGQDWNLLTTIKTNKDGFNRVGINNPSVNRLKLANDSGGDIDVDNISVTVFPSGQPPVVRTGEASGIGQNSAVVTGSLISAGNKKVVELGVCWSVESIPLIADHKVLVDGEPSEYNLGLNQLPAGTRIYYRAFATSRAGTGYGEIKDFETLPATTPVVSTVSVTRLTGESAWTGGILSDVGGSPVVRRGVCWSTVNTPTIDDEYIDVSDVSHEFKVRIQILLPQTTYYCRAYAVNDAGVGYGQTESFTTGEVSSAEVVTVGLESAASFKVLAKGRLTDSGNSVVTKGFCWNLTGMPDTDDFTTETRTDENDFSAWITNLQSASTYYVRAYASNSVGTVYGEEMVLVTPAARIYYVSPEGDDDQADGTESNPFYSLQKAVDLVEAGDTIFMKGGTYTYTTRINIGTVGQPDGGTIALFAEKGKRALLDFSTMPFDSNNQGIRLTGSYWHIWGLDIKGAGDNGMLIERSKPVGGTYIDVMNRTYEAHHNTIEFCSFFENRDTGLQLKNMAADNRIINCDSYFNCDPDHGDADGFAPKLTVGSGNYFYGCRAWNNSDDGWDGLLTAVENGFPDDMTTTIENCWAFNNGFLKDGRESKGNGNGFKLGGGTAQRHNMILKRCLAFDNLMKGFDQNHNIGDMILINCTGYASKYPNKNHYTYKIDGTILAPGKQLVLTNSIAVWDGLDADKSAYAPCRLDGGIVTTSDFMTSATDFVSIQPVGVTAARQADGSLPDIDFMKIQPDNDKLIDRGTIVDGIQYEGVAPDLGCFETLGTLTGIDDILENSSNEALLVVYPQPVRDNFTVVLREQAEDDSMNLLQILDTNGYLLYQKTFGGLATKVDRGGLEQGMYILRVVNRETGKSQSTKLILQ